MSDEFGSLKINTAYAAKYEERKRKEELSRLKEKYGEDAGAENDSSSSESEDEEATGVTVKNNQEFLRTLSLIKAKDSRVTDPSYHFYHSETESPEDNNSTGTSKKNKPMYLRDYERKRLVEKGSLALVSSDEEEGNDGSSSKKKSQLIYDREQKELRESLKRSIAAVESDDDDEEEPLLKLRKKTDEEIEREDEDYVRWLEGKEGSKLNKQMAHDMSALQRYWTDPNLNEDERFLRDYILHKGYIDKAAKRIPTYDELVSDRGHHDDDDDEEEVEKQEQFERKYNFRFEEPGAEKIISYPRNITGSVRVQDESRKIKRKERKSRKEREKEEKREELKRLKKLKRKEIQAKLEKLKEVTGNATVGFDATAIEQDFNPEEYDHMMQSAFDEEYYSRGDEDEEKPMFDDMESGNEDDEDWDTWGGEDEDKDEGVHADDPDFNMDADFDPSMRHVVSHSQDELTSSRKHRKRSRFAEALQRKKPTFDPDENNFEEYFDEYYQLDYEDIVADQPCRFKYRKVTPNDFGLSVEEMLACDKGELNKWASLKKIVGYRTQEEEARDVKKYKRKGKKHKRKLQLLPSIQQLETEEAGASSRKEARSREVTRGKKMQRKAKKEKCSARAEGREVGVASKISHSRLKSYGVKSKISQRKLK